LGYKLITSTWDYYGTDYQLPAGFLSASSDATPVELVYDGTGFAIQNIISKSPKFYDIVEVYGDPNEPDFKSEMSPSAINLRSALEPVTDVVRIEENLEGFRLWFNRQTDATKRGRLVYSLRQFYFLLTGSTSGESRIFSITDSGGYLSTINNLAVQKKAAEWSDTSLKASVSLELSIYANLAAITAAIPVPREGMMVRVTGQGNATYIGGAWKKCTDETTLIT